MSEMQTKWGLSALAGFQQVPDLLLRHQTSLGLQSNDLVVLLHLTMFWWYADRLPFPGTPVIAKRMGVTTRTVQRSLERLSRLGLVSRVKVGTKRGERAGWDPAGVVGKLNVLAAADPRVQSKTLASGAGA